MFPAGAQCHAFELGFLSCIHQRLCSPLGSGHSAKRTEFRLYNRYGAVQRLAGCSHRRQSATCRSGRGNEPRSVRRMTYHRPLRMAIRWPTVRAAHPILRCGVSGIRRGGTLKSFSAPELKLRVPSDTIARFDAALDTRPRCHDARHTHPCLTSLDRLVCQQGRSVHSLCAGSSPSVRAGLKGSKAVSPFKQRTSSY